MALRARRGGGNGLEAWPGYVDALSTLLMVVMFVLLVFVMAQAFESVVLAKRNDQLTVANQTLTLERERNAALSGSVTRLNENLAAGDAARAALLAQLQDLNMQTANTMAERDKVAATLKEVELAAAAAAAMNRTLTTRVETQTQRANAQTQRADAAARANQQLTVELTEKAKSIEQSRREAAAAEARLREMRVQIAALDQTVKADKATIDINLSELARVTEQTRALTAELAEKTKTIDQARQEAAAAEARMREMRAQMAALDKTVKADKATIDLNLSELARLAEQMRALTALRDELEKQAKTAAAAAMTEEQKRRAVELLFADEKKLGDSSRARIAMLTQQVEQLRQDLTVTQRLRADEQARATGLTEQLNLALAAQVEELRKYRSDFFGKLRAVLTGRPGIEVVGDRFVFQSEVLFGVSSSELTAAGTAQMTDLAATFRKIIEEIPGDVNWVLRVDGHTDATPIRNARFPSNWELSAARAITVVKFLTAQGIPARHLAATGFGENQPVDPADTPEAFAKNRRIEIRLTDR